MKQVTFIHGADLHLDSPMVGLKSLPERIFKRLQESTFQAFRNLVNSAINYQVDFVILAGDLFDNEDRSVRAQVFLKNEMKRLANEGIAVYIVHGNHDHLSGNWASIQLPENAHTFSKQVEMKRHQSKETIVHLYGFSYPERHVFDRKIDEYRLIPGADFHIGILHGNVEGNVDHGNYAPFQVKDLLGKNFDYWALGHIHKKSILNEEPSIVYPGNLQGRNRKEQGEKGCYLINLTESSTELQFIETNDVIWKDFFIDASNCSSLDELYQLCNSHLENARREGKGILACFEIENLYFRDETFDSTLKEELLETLQEQEKEEDSFVWPVKINVTDSMHWERDKLSEESDFYGELFEAIEKFEGFEKTVAPLYEHPIARKFLPTLSENDMEEIKGKAEALLIQQLLKRS